MCSPDSHSPRQCLARVAEAIVKHFAADNSVCNSWTERPISKFVGLWIQVHGIADAGCKAKSSCGGVCESVLISCMSPAPMGKSDWAAPHVYLLYCARGWQSRSSLVHRTRKLATYIPTLVFFLLLRHASTISVNPKHCPSTAYEWQSSQCVHYDSCAVLCFTVKTHCPVYAHCQPCPKQPQQTKVRASFDRPRACDHQDFAQTRTGST